MINYFLIPLILVVFLLPGFLIASRYGGRSGTTWFSQLALGFAISFFPFSLLGVLFLWLKGDSTVFLAILVGTFTCWIVWLVTLAWVHPKPKRGPPRKNWTIGLFLLVPLAILFARDRNPLDNYYYVSAAMSYSNATSFNAEEPVHREGWPVLPPWRTATFELWVGTLSRLSGLHPMFLYHRILPLFVLLLCYGAYWLLLKELVQRKKISLAFFLTILSHVYLWTFWNDRPQWGPISKLLEWPTMPKSMAAHFYAPLIAAFTLRFLRRGKMGDWLILSMAIIDAVATTQTALFSIFFLVGLLAPSYFIVTGKRCLKKMVYCVLSLLPILLWGLWLRGYYSARGWLQELFYQHEWRDIAPLYFKNHGGLLLCAASIPLALTLLKNRNQRAYLIGFPILLTLVAVNPAVYRFICSTFTSFEGHGVLMWIYPEAIFWSVLGTQCLNIRWFRKLNPAIPVAMLLLILLAPKGKDILRGVRDELVSIKENPLMLPTQLTPILTTLSEDTRIESRRILCNEWVAQFLVGFSPRFKLVSALPHYTDVSLYLQGRSTEAVERYFLQAVVAMEQADHLWDDFTQTFGKARALRLFE